MNDKSPASTVNTEESAINAVLDKLYAAWEANDADAFVADYTEDATAILTGSYRENRQVVRDRMAESFAGPLKGSRAYDESRTMRFPAAGTAVVVSRGGVVPAGQSEVPDGYWVLATWTLVKRDDRWQIVAYHNCPA